MRVFGRLGRVFLVVAAIGLVLGVVGLITDVQALRTVGLVLTITFAVLGVVFVLVQRSIFGSAAAMRRIETAGIPAVGLIDRIGGSLGHVGADPILRITCTVGLGQISLRTVVPIQHIVRIQVGGRLPLLIDPEQPASALVDWSRLDSIGWIG